MLHEMYGVFPIKFDLNLNLDGRYRPRANVIQIRVFGSREISVL